MPYLPIEEYGLIGNMRTSALVGVNGSIDWFCFPYFDSPSVFGAVLDDRKGGWCKIAPQGNEATPKQYYWPDTNVLVTRFLSEQGVGQVIDFMPVGLKATEAGHHGIIRRVQAIRGNVTFRLECFSRIQLRSRPAHDNPDFRGRLFRSPGPEFVVGIDHSLTTGRQRRRR